MGWFTKWRGSPESTRQTKGQPKDKDLREKAKLRPGLPREPRSLGARVHRDLRLGGRIHLWGGAFLGGHRAGKRGSQRWDIPVRSSPRD